MAVVWDLENAAHLLRRAAFGGTTQDIQAFHDRYASVDEAVDDLLSFSTSSKKPPGGGRDFYRAQIKQRQWWLKSMLKATNPKDALREKLTLFWHSHLCSGYSKQPVASYMSIQNGLFRRYAKGNFRDLVRDFNRDPANLYYLDGITNYASADGVHVSANENFGREVLELFTVGISEFAADGSNDPSKPNYTESDVHQLARALTGWVELDKDVGVWRDWAWDGGQYDDDGDDNPDPITIFGVTNSNFKIGEEVAGTPDDVLKLIFEQTDTAGNPQAAMFLCRKLWTYFAYPAPAPGLKTLLEGFAAILDGADYEIAPVLAAMLKSDEFYSDTAKSRTIKNPVDYMVGIFRMLGIKSNGKTLGDSDELIDMLGEMGMYLFEPPNVAGWPGGKRWITTGTLVSRLDFARQIAELDYSGSALHLSTVVTMGSATADPDTVLAEIIARCHLDGTLGGVALTANQIAALRNFLTNQSTKTSLDLSADDTFDAERLVRGTIALALQSAEAMIF
ncbi:MAG TPA: DUF1800 family protein [Candidatus Limnocylindrales bacterium]|nr:DUF1800 family protein [Candidatus Limnocylindrales bacterium]